MTNMRVSSWPDLIPDALNQLNSRPLARLNGLAPKDFNTPFDDVKLESKPPSTSDGIEEAKANQANYESTSKELQVGAFVFADKKKTSTFAKSFSLKVNGIFLCSLQ